MPLFSVVPGAIICVEAILKSLVLLVLVLELVLIPEFELAIISPESALLFVVSPELLVVFTEAVMGWLLNEGTEATGLVAGNTF